MTTEEIKYRFMGILCEAANDQRQPVDTLNDMMESVKNLVQEMGRGEKRTTNFERWKSKLKPEDLIITDFCVNEVMAVFDGHGDRCEHCPAKDTCSARCDEEIECESEFLAWANAEATEEPK